jgi:hypothetical protein
MSKKDFETREFNFNDRDRYGDFGDYGDGYNSSKKKNNDPFVEDLYEDDDLYSYSDDYRNSLYGAKSKAPIAIIVTSVVAAIVIILIVVLAVRGCSSAPAATQATTATATEYEYEDETDEEFTTEAY